MDHTHVRNVGEAPVKLEYILPTNNNRLSRKSSLKDNINIIGDASPSVAPKEVNNGEDGIGENTEGAALNSDAITPIATKILPCDISSSNITNGNVILPNSDLKQLENESCLLKRELPISDQQPPKKKQKGQNKARPRTVPKQKSENRICPSILVNEECTYGDKCRFSHDVEKYIKSKGPDLGDVCVNFSLTGKCRFGIECMFSKQHVTEDFKNIIEKERYQRYCEENKYCNALKRDVLISVRKKKYEFPRSTEYLRKVDGNNLKVEESGNNKLGDSISHDSIAPINAREKRKIDFAGKLYLAPLTTVGNLPFRQICKKFGADITCGEMAMSTNLLKCAQAEWSLIKRHPSEDIFGVQLCGGYPDTMTRVTELLSKECDVDFIDINMGCPIDLVYKKGEGSALMRRLNKLEMIVKGMVEVSDVPITIKMRTGVTENKINAHEIVPLLKEWGVDLITLHGRTREQRYTKVADWEYINKCAELCSPVPLFGNGDILSFEEANMKTPTSGVMIARGALIKPWIFTEIKEQRHWDISSNERFDILKDFTNAGLIHWGSDFKGVENTRRFLLEWLSFLHRYIPVGLLEVLPQKINERAPSYFGRNDLETLFASEKAADWVKISEMLLGPVPDTFTFIPKHKANAYS